MQAVYNNGELGDRLTFDDAGFKDLIKDSSVDHVRVFEESRGNVGIQEIQDTQIEKVVLKVMSQEKQKQVLKSDYDKLTSQFDSTLKN